ncbi:hypothetical protein ACOSQ2_008000 [Xanthoceras sorbifolium]
MMFPEGFVRHLPRINSDHCPIVLNLYSAHIPNNSLKPFRFEAMWSSHAEYSGLVSNCWTRNVGSLSEKLNALAANLKDWNRDSFGCIFRRKRVLLARILGIQKSLSFNYNSSLVSLEYHLSSEYNDIINQEEMFWHQKSRNNWLRCGDRNTKFFHLSTMIRRRRNKIEGLRDVNGDWVDDKFGLKRIACDYFISLFSYKNASFDYASLPALFPTIDDISRENMCRGISEEEVKSSLFDIRGLKAPGPDGFPKTQKRLASWKSATFSMAGRVTLIKAVTAAIPFYSMQTIKLPNDMCCRLDKVNRDFLWGHTVDKKTIHLVNWRTVCTPKGNGGLGIKSTKLMNQSLLAKAGWRILQGDKGVWSQLLTCKYLNNANLLTPGDSDKSVCSNTWKGIKFGAKLLSSGINWRIGNGNSVHFWTDVWASDCGSLANHAAVALNDTLLSEKVKDYVVEAGWNLRKLATVLPWNIIHKITKIHIGNIPDKIIWGGCSKGNFSVKTAYNLMLDSDSPSWQWNFIWKMKLPPKVLTFLWSLLHEKILTNDHRRARCLTTDSSCPRCFSGLESIDHLLRGCKSSVGIWNQVCTGFSSSTTFSDSFISWIYANLKNTTIIVGDAPWYMVFALTVWYIWKWRCCKVFDINFVIHVNSHIPIFILLWWSLIPGMLLALLIQGLV